MTTKPLRVRVAPTVSRPTSRRADACESTPLSQATHGDTAHYIATLAASLEQLAVARELPFLAHLLGMVVEEAREILARTHSETRTHTR